MVPAQNGITAVDAMQFQLEMAIEDTNTFNNAKWLGGIMSRKELASTE